MTAVNIKMFAKLVEGSEAEVLEKLARVQRTFATLLFGRVMTATPVDTGRARGSWRINVNQDMEDFDLGKDYNGGGESENKKQLEKLSALTFPGYTVLSNSLPYIQHLEDAGSTQSGPGEMVAENVGAAQRLMNVAIKREAKK